MITIVSGLPRSGTSLMMHMLEEGGMSSLTDPMRVPDANNPNGYFEYAPVKRLAQDTSWLYEAEGKVVKVIAPLLPHLPAGYLYKVILMQRDLREVLASQQRMLERMGRPCGTVEVLRGVYEQHMARARRWAKQPHMALLEIAHADLFTDATGISSAVADFLGEQLRIEDMVQVIDPALYRERQAQDAEQAASGPIASA